MIKFLRFAALSAAFGFSTLASSPASAASLADCGNIDISANAQCTAEVSGGCTTQCEAVSFEAACNAKFAVECNGQCTATAEASCTGSCNTDCQAECTVNPGSFDCSGACTADCSADCSAQCSTAADKTKCEGECKGSCSATCGGKCEGTPATADCTAKCSAKCEGQCTAKVNMGCQIDCQVTKDPVTCEATLKGGCNTQCSDPNGALFCDGQYVDTNGNAKSCYDALVALLPTITVTGSASWSSGCNNGTCTAEGKAEGSASCAMSEKPTDTSGMAAALAGLAGLTVVARRRRRR